MPSHIVYVDGASRGNPGDAAVGVSLCDERGTELATVSKAIGPATNNEAEYTALIEALRLCQSRKIREVDVRADSELIVRQMNGEYRVREPKLIPLAEEARRLARSFERFSIVHVRREKNSRADELANQALDSAGY